jgi:hypothetical protein
MSDDLMLKMGARGVGYQETCIGNYQWRASGGLLFFESEAVNLC